MDFAAEFERKKRLVEAGLERYLPAEDAYPPLIHRAMRYSALAGGKRLRPVLVLAAAEAVGGEAERVLPAACALEVLHTYTLVHDDLPAMDNDDLRRGRPTSHRVFGEAAAILAGDALLTLAFKLLALCATEKGLPAEAVVRVIGEVADLAGSSGLIGGQVLDTLAEPGEVNGATLEYVHRHKTGALYRAAVRTGALLSGATEAELRALTCYADHLGLAFQIVDDILDVEGRTEVLGKTAGSDRRNRRQTYPALYGVEAARQRAATLGARAAASLKEFGPRGAFLCGVVEFVLGREF
ncbi:MAG: polyprenyl synthetase family protein [Firmicutes bacterium]|nr:polyprenyl synthetase family protein [Bacillota bacterium]